MSALYSDVNFTVSIDPVEIVEDAKAINQNIASIFDTPVGSKWWRPNIGSNVESLLWEPIDEVTADALKNDMELALERNGEFRVQFKSVLVIPDIPAQNYYVEIAYTAPMLEKKNQIFKFNLSRGIK